MSKNKNSKHSELLPVSEIKTHILNRYNLNNANIETVKFKNTDKQRAVYKVIDKNQEYCLKKVYYDEGNLLYVYSAMEWLYRNNILLPRLLPTIDNGRFVNYKNMLFILSPWLEGEKCNFDDINHINLSISTLANLHKVSKDFIPITGSSQRLGYVDLHTSSCKHLNQLLENANRAYRVRDRFSKTYLENLDYNLELAKLSIELSSKISENELSKSLCHGDYVNKNILIHNNKTCIIDFDKCQYDYSAHDISYFLRRLLKREKTNWQSNLTLNVIYEYMENNNLSKSDILYILSYICFPQKYWKISRDYYKNLKKCNKNSFQIILERGLDKTTNQLKFAYEIIDLFSKKYLI